MAWFPSLWSCAAAVLLVAWVVARRWRSQAGNPLHNEEAARINVRRQRLAGARLSLLTTNDLHSAVEGSSGASIGHYARLGAMLTDERMRQAERGAVVLTLDSGDWLGGTVYDGLGPSEDSSFAPELEFLKMYGFDATTLGNHDFDAGEAGLLRMFRKQSSVPVIATNMLKPNSTSDLAGEIFSATTRHAVLEYQVKLSATSSAGPTSASLKVGILGIVGPDAALISRSVRGSRETVRFSGFDDETMMLRPEELHALVAASARSLRDDGQVDLVLVLFHGGMAESQQLARAVGPVVDAVLGGHSHEVYYKEEVVGTGDGQQVIHSSQCGCEGQFLGVLRLKISESGALVVDTDAGPSEDGGERNSFCRPVAGNFWDAELAEQVIPKWRADLQEQSAVGRAAAARGWNVFGSVLYTAGDLRHLLSSIGSELTVPLKPAEAISTALLASVNKNLRRLGSPPADVYITCEECARGLPDPAENGTASSEGDSVTLDAVYGLISLTTVSPIAVFYMPKRRLANLLDLSDLFCRLVSTSYGVAASSSLRYTIGSGLGIPFLNRLQDLSLHGRPYEDWPELVRVASSSYILPSFFSTARLTRGLLTMNPVRTDGKDCEGVDETLDERLPLEYLLFAEYIAGLGS